MSISIDGTSIIVDQARLELVNGFNAETGVAYLVITPEGGTGEIPFLAQGLPGQPTLFPSIRVVEHPATEPLPAINPVATLLDPGGAGEPAKYDLEFHIHAGPKGDTGTPSIANAADIDTTVALDSTADKYILVYRSSDQKWVPAAQKVGDTYPATSIAATAFNNQATRLLTSVTVPAQPFDWRPRCFAQTVVTGSVDTRVDLIARLNDQASGDQVGYAKGLIGANTAGVQTVMIPALPVGSTVPGAFGKVLKGNAATIYLRAEQKAASSNSWSTPAAPDTTFQVEVQAVP